MRGAAGSAIEVDQSTDGNDWQTLTDNLPGSTTSYADTSGLSEATHYFYRVTPIWAAGPSVFSNIADAWTLANAPSNLIAQVVGPNEIDLAWTNNSTAATQFQIERSDDGSNFYLLDTVTADAYADMLATDGSTSWYRVEALNDDADASAPSNVTSATTALAPPTELTATAVSASEIDLTWNDESYIATSLKLERSTDDVNFAPLSTTLPPDTSTYEDTGLSAGTQYYYRVTSLAGSQSSGPSGTADDTTIPPAPTALSATPSSSSSIDLSWSAVQGASGYEVDRKVGSDWVDLTEIPDATVTTFTDNSLLENTNYSFQISAYNNAGSSSPAAASATTPVGTPAAPSGLQAIVLSPTSAELVWINNADNEQGFHIDKSDDGGFSWTRLGATDPGTTNYIDGGLQPGQTRLYEVVAYNSAGDSGFDGDSASVSVTTPSLPTGALQPPQPPLNLTAAGSTAKIQLQWSPSPTPRVNYWVERQLPGGSNWGVIGITAATTYSDNPSLLGVDFNYRVLAANAEYASAPTATASAMKLYPVPPPPDGVVHHPWQQGYKATISWKPATDPASVQQYLVEVTYTFSGNTATIPVTGNECTITASASDPDFSYEVYSSNQSGTSSEGSSSSNGNFVETKDDPNIGGAIQSASVDAQGQVTLTTTGGAISEVEYTDDPTFNNWVGTVGVTNNGGTSTINVPLGAHLWIRSYQGGGNIVPLNIPSLPQIGGLSEETDGADAYGNASYASLYYNWGPLAPQADAQMEFSVDAGSFGHFTSAGTSSGTQLESPNVDGPPFEGGTYIGELRQEQTLSSMPVITGYSNWQSYDSMNAMPAAPLSVSATPISGGKVRLLWAEGSEGETQQTIECLTGPNLNIVAATTTVGAGTTTFDFGPLAAGRYEFRIMESNGTADTNPMGANSPWATSVPVSVGSTNVGISELENAAELGPDDHPQDGYFEITRTGSTDAPLTLSVDLSGTATVGTQYTTDAGQSSTVQVTIPAGASAAMLTVEPLLDGLDDPAPLNVVATIESQPGANVITASATDNINESPTLGNVTVAGSPGASVTVGDNTPMHLFLPQPATGSAKIMISAAPASSHVLWSVSGGNNSSPGMRNNFGLGNPTVALAPANGNSTFTVTVGVDRNGNGVLDANEVQRTTDVNVGSPDLEVDSNNDGQITAADRPIKDAKGTPGVVLIVNDFDGDGDGVPDFADGYNRDTSTESAPSGYYLASTADDQGPGQYFYPINVTLPEGIDLNTARI